MIRLVRFLLNAGSFFQRIEPGESEMEIFNCPFSRLDETPDLGEVSFRIKRKFLEKVAKDSQLSN